MYAASTCKSGLLSLSSSISFSSSFSFPPSLHLSLLLSYTSSSSLGIIVRMYIDFLILLTDFFIFMFFHSCLFLEHSIFLIKIEIALIHRQAHGVYKRRFIISRGHNNESTIEF